MLGKIAGMAVISNKENVPGVEQKDIVAEKIGLQAMDAMALLVEKMIMNVF